MHPSDIGARSEALVLARLVSEGHTVLTPFGSNHRYDLVVDEEGEFTRIQVKTGLRRKGSLSFRATSSHAHRGHPDRPYTPNEVDLFAVYDTVGDQIFWVPVGTVGQRPHLRLDPVGDYLRTKRSVRWAADFAACPFCKGA